MSSVNFACKYVALLYRDDSNGVDDAFERVNSLLQRKEFDVIRDKLHSIQEDGLGFDKEVNELLNDLDELEKVSE